MQIAKRMKCIKPSATLAVNAKSLELKSQGVEVASLAVGEPNFNTPEHICLAAKKAMDDGYTKYTAVAGIAELRDAVCHYYSRTYGITVARESVVISNGGKHSLYNLFQIILNQGDEVLIPAPYWISYPDMVLLAGGEPVYVQASVAENFKINVEKLESSRTFKTKILVLNSPSNPTGAVYTQDELDSIAQWAVDNNIFIISDEIYDQLIYAPARAASLSKWWEKYPDKFAIVNGLAKTFAMTGWRVGFCVMHMDIAKAMNTLQGQSTSNVCSIAQWAAVAALNGPYDCVEQMRASFAQRRDLALSIVNTWTKAKCPKPDGAFYLFVDVSAYYGKNFSNSVELCTKLLEEVHVALVPGAAFGDDACVRFSYAVSDEVIKEAFNKVGDFLLK